MKKPLLFFSIFAVLWFCEISRSAERKLELGVEVDRIEIVGATVFLQADLEAALEILPGDKLERVKLVRTAENLQALYRIHGYEQMGVQSRLFRMKNTDGKAEIVLQLQISEGKPTRVAWIKFIPQNLREKFFEKSWEKIETMLHGKLGFSAGDILDKGKISSGKRLVQDLLASVEFVGARVEDPRVIGEQAMPKDSHASAAAWVGLEFLVDLGDRVTFGFRGNKIIPSTDLSGLIAEQRLIGFGKDYVGAIKISIEDAYKSHGYAWVKVMPYTVEQQKTHERHVTFVIEEGPRLSIGEVAFDGNYVFSDDELRRQFFARVAPSVQNGYYVEREVQKAADLLIEWIKSRGYLFAKTVAINTLYADKMVKLVIYLYEGDQTLVQSISFSGAQLFSEEELKRRIGVRENEALNLFSFNEGIENLKAAYRAKGYLSMRIPNEGTDKIVKYSHENRLADISVEIAEGPQYKVGEIHVEGLTRTKEYVVKRELQFKEGDILSEPSLLESEKRLRRLGIFSSVNIRTLEDPGKEGYKTVRVSVEEGEPGVLAGGVGFRNDFGPRLFGQVGYANLFGRNHVLSLSSTINRRLEDYRLIEGQVQLAYAWPWFAISELTFRPALTIGSAQYRSFDVYSVSIATTWEKRLIKNPQLNGVFAYSLERVRQLNAVFEIDKQDLQIGSITPGLSLDMRDNPLSPMAGFFGSTSYEIASPFFFSQRSPYRLGYTRFQFRSDYYLTALRDIVFFFSFRTGLGRNTEAPLGDPDDPNNKSGTIPMIKQFTLGGPSSLRGFREQELNFLNVNIHGTLSYVNYRLQIDLPFSGAMKFGPFIDAGNLMLDRSSLGGLRYGAGIGFHYRTPVGPVNLDWASKIDPQPGEDPFLFHFSIGVI